MRRGRAAHSLEPLGGVLRRSADLRVPPTVEASPIAGRDWEAAVGSRIAARARPIKLERGVLLVRAASATWAQELTLLSEEITTQLRARGFPVKALRFRVGHVDAPERPPDRDEVRKAPPEAPLPDVVRASLDRVGDPQLREAIARAAAKNLGWQAARDEHSSKPESKGRGTPRGQPATGSKRAGAAPPSAAPRDARGPRDAASETDRSDRTERPPRGGRPGKP